MNGTGAIHRAKPWLAVVASGLALCFSLPPWGWWPLAPIGLAGIGLTIRGGRARRRFALALAGFFVQFALSLMWMRDFSIPGYIGACIFESIMLAVAVAAAPREGTGRWVAIAGAFTLGEIVRWSFPFGGVPLSSIALSGADSPLRWAVPLGGSMALVLTIALLAGVIGEAYSRRLATAACLAIAAISLPVVGALLPGTHVTGQLRIALVQGGGPLGTRGIHDQPGVVIGRHLAATKTIAPGSVDLVLWPEDVVGVSDPLAQTPEAAAIAEQARRIGAVIIAGVVQDVSDCCWLNEAVAWDANGNIVDTYNKVHRVPFGEFIPFRSLVAKVADLSLIPREAIAGTGPGILHTPVGNFGVAISFELFHPDRASSGIDIGGSVLLGPTNSSSYRDSMVPTQTVNASRLRALETGRTVAQVSPTGFAAVITSDGTLIARSSLKEQRVITATIDTRSGHTVYSRIGDWPIAVIALGLLGTGWALQLEKKRHRAVVDELDGHVGPKSPGGHDGSESA